MRSAQPYNNKQKATYYDEYEPPSKDIKTRIILSQEKLRNVIQDP